MPCTTVLVGKKASNDRSTMIARTDDGHFDVKKLIVVASSPIWRSSFPRSRCTIPPVRVSTRRTVSGRPPASTPRTSA